MKTRTPLLVLRLLPIKMTFSTMNQLRPRGSVAITALISLALLNTRLSAAEPGARPPSQWVHPGPDGKLVYKATPNGDRIMDFSHAGYMGGGVALPNVPVKRTVRPSGGDDTAAIQAAITEVAALPLEGLFRGAVLLSPGTFTCTGMISIPASGIVLRGSGSGVAAGAKSTVKMSGRPHTAIALRAPRGERGERSGRGQPADSQSSGSAVTTIADAHVPSGTSSFTLSNVADFAVGDTIEIRRPVTEAWVRFMEMHNLVRDGRPQTWLRPGNTTICERRITAISGRTITLDVPVSDSFDAKYLNPPGTVVAKIKPPTRISQSGIESLHIESPPQPISHAQPHFSALRISGEDCWVRDVVAEETMNSIGISGWRITLEHVSVNRQALHQGSSRPAEFAPNASQVLLDRCSVNADNVWFVATGSGQSGPIVLLNCSFQGNGRAESHQRWSTGMLYDNCRVPKGGLDFRNRGSMGSGHGWSMGWGVAWNCEAQDFVIQKPPGAFNWMIGCKGQSRSMPRPFGSAPTLPEGIIDLPGTPVTPESLYLAQLAERLGPPALKNIGYTSSARSERPHATP